jgi:hypothetical protein
MNRRLLIFICMFHAAFAHGYDRQRAKTSLAGELTECAAYFIVVSEFVEHAILAGSAVSSRTAA